MRNIVFLFAVLFMVFFSSCSSGFVHYRVKTSDGMILDIHREKIPAFKKGDKVQLKEYRGDWVIDEHPGWFMDTLYFIESDSFPDLIIHKKTAIIEEIIE